MFKKFLMVSLLIPVFGFSSEEALMTRKSELTRVVDQSYSDRNSSFCWGAVQGLVGSSFLAAVADQKNKMSSEDRALNGLIGGVLAWYSLSNIVNIFDHQRKINRDSQELLDLQKRLNAPVAPAVLSFDIDAFQRDLEKLRAGLLQPRD